MWGKRLAYISPINQTNNEMFKTCSDWSVLYRFYCWKENIITTAGGLIEQSNCIFCSIECDIQLLTVKLKMPRLTILNSYSNVNTTSARRSPTKSYFSIFLIRQIITKYCSCSSMLINYKKKLIRSLPFYMKVFR